MQNHTVDAFTRHTASQVVYQIFPERFLPSAADLAAQQAGAVGVRPAQRDPARLG